MDGPFCVDCRHYRPPSMHLAREAHCYRPQGLSLVTGKPEVDRERPCRLERVVKDEGWCGPEGRFFEANDK